MDSISPDGPAAMPAGMPDDVLIVEDDAIIALDFEQTVAEFGVTSVRIASSVAQALAMIAELIPDFALLDIGLSEEKSFAVAKRLAALKIPFAFVTGYSDDRSFHRNTQTGPNSQNRFRGINCSRILSDWQSYGAK